MLKISLICSLALALSMGCQSDKPRSLPVLQPSDFNQEFVDESMHDVNGNYHVGDFFLFNQNGDTITHAAYDDKIYVVDFFFTWCPSICPIMTDNMRLLHEAFSENDDFLLLSVSVTPERDSVSVLKAYAEQHKINDAKWNLTTGNKKHIYNLARKSYFAASDKGDGGLQDFIHTPNFVLVDKQKQIRGVYDGTKPEEIERLIADIKLLLYQEKIV